MRNNCNIQLFMLIVDIELVKNDNSNFYNKLKKMQLLYKT